MKIISLKTENVLRLKAVEITPEGHVVVVKGRNAAGKSSVLESIRYALEGTSRVPPEVIHRGERRGEVELDLGEYTVRRTFSKGGSALEVRSKEGTKVASPQALLDKITGRLCFDPMGFTRLDKKQKGEVLKKVAGLDFADLDKRRAGAYEARTAAKKDAAALNARLQAVPPVPGIGPKAEEVSLKALLAELDQRLGEAAETQSARRRLAELRVAEQQAAALIPKHHDAVKDLVREYEAKLANVRAGLELAQKRADDLAAEIVKLEEVTKDLKDPDVDAVRARIASADETNRRVRAAKERRALEDELDKAEGRAKALDDGVAEIDAKKARAIREAVMPVPGLGFDEEDGVTFNGLPLEQASDSERLRVSMAMGFALNPTLRVVLLREGCFLDEDSMRVVAEMAAAADAQVWVERVGTSPEEVEGGVCILIEDGCVAPEGLS